MIVGIIDTGICNTRSLQFALKKLGVACEIIVKEQIPTD